MLAPALGLTASVSWGVGDFIAGVRSRRLSVLTVLVVSQAAGLVSIAALVVLRGDGPPPARYLVDAALAGLCATVGLAAFYRGLAIGAMSVVAPISATSAVVPVVVGVAGGERPSGIQAAGIAIALVGVVLVSREPGVGGPRRRAAGVGLALLAALAFGLLLVALDASSNGDALWGTLGLKITSFTLFTLAALAIRPSFARARPDVLALVAVGVLDTAGVAFFALASTEGLLTVVAVLAQLYPVVTVLLARVLLRERISSRQWLGVYGALVGATLITAG